MTRDTHDPPAASQRFARSIAAAGWCLLLLAGLLWIASYLSASRIALRATGATVLAGPDRAVRSGAEGDAAQASVLRTGPGSRVGWTLALRRGTHRFRAAVSVIAGESDTASHTFRVLLVEAGRERAIAAARVTPDRRASWTSIDQEFETSDRDLLLVLETDGDRGSAAAGDAFRWKEPSVDEGTSPLPAVPFVAGLLALLWAVWRSGPVATCRPLLRAASAALLWLGPSALSILACEQLLRARGDLLPPRLLEETTRAGLAIFPDQDRARVYRRDLGHLPRPGRCVSAAPVGDLIDGEIVASAWRERDVPAVELCTDRDGFRAPSPAGDLDVVALGDSFTQAPQVSTEQAWPGALAARGAIRVGNFGVSGHGPQQYLGILNGFALARHPKVVVVALFEGNDIQEAEQFARFEASGLAWNEFQALRRGGRDETRAIPRIRRSVVTSAVRLAGATLLEEWGLTGGSAGALPGQGFNPVSGEIAGRRLAMSFHPVYLERAAFDASAWRRQRGFELTLDALLGAREACDRIGAHLLVMLIPSKESLYLPLFATPPTPGAFRAFLEAARPQRDPPDWRDLLEHRRALTELLAATLEDHGIEAVRLAEPFASRAAEGEMLYFASDTHWNPAGHALAAEILSRRVRALLDRPQS